VLEIEDSGWIGSNEVTLTLTNRIVTVKTRVDPQLSVCSILTFKWDILTEIYYGLWIKRRENGISVLRRIPKIWINDKSVWKSQMRGVLKFESRKSKVGRCVSSKSRYNEEKRRIEGNMMTNSWQLFMESELSRFACFKFKNWELCMKNEKIFKVKCWMVFKFERPSDEINRRTGKCIFISSEVQDW